MSNALFLRHPRSGDRGSGLYPMLRNVEGAILVLAALVVILLGWCAWKLVRALKSQG